MRKEKIVLVTVSDDRSGRKDGKYSETQDRVLDLFRNNSTFGVTDFSFWKWEDIKNSEFYKKNNRMLDQIDPAMNGRCYKPFVILESLRSAEDGDFIIYNDVSPEIWSKWEHNKIIDPSIYDIGVIKNLCVQNGGILTASADWYCNGEVADHTHENFTLERCIDKMEMQDYKYGKIGHRHDQSISGLLINKMGNNLVRNNGSYNFLSYCEINCGYEFIESNPPKGQYIYRTMLVDNSWQYIKSNR